MVAPLTMKGSWESLWEQRKGSLLYIEFEKTRDLNMHAQVGVADTALDSRRPEGRSS